MSTVKKYPILGGPLHGKHANLKDFQVAYSNPRYPEHDREAGQFAAFVDDYLPYNAGERRGPASMVYIYSPGVPHPERMHQDDS